MNKSNDNRNALLPFNMPWEDYTSMFEEKPPESLSIVINTIAVGSVDLIGLTPLRQRLTEGLQEVLQVPENSLDQPQLRTRWGIQDLNWRIDLNSAMSVTEFPKSYQLLRAWTVDKTYIQLGFKRPGMTAANIGIALAMHSYDELVAKYGSTEPSEHSPVSADPLDIKRYGMWIGDGYVTRSAVWCRGLLDIRNRWLVTLRAIATGKDSHLAYDHFLAVGGQYFLDYPKLCR